MHNTIFVHHLDLRLYSVHQKKKCAIVYHYFYHHDGLLVLRHNIDFGYLFSMLLEGQFFGLRLVMNEFAEFSHTS